MFFKEFEKKEKIRTRFIFAKKIIIIKTQEKTLCFKFICFGGVEKEEGGVGSRKERGREGGEKKSGNKDGFEVRKCLEYFQEERERE